MENILTVHNSSILHAVEPKSGRTLLRIAVEQDNGSAPLNCSLHQLCSTVFPQCQDLDMGQHEAKNNTVTIKLSDSCTLHSDLLMTLASITSGAASKFDATDADIVSIGNESTSSNGSVECHPQYTQVCGLCVPRCNQYQAYLQSNGQQNLNEVALIAASCTCVLGGVIFIALSITRRKEM